MGQKINPKGFRIGTTFTWGSRWFADSRHYKQLLPNPETCMMFYAYRNLGGGTPPTNDGQNAFTTRCVQVLPLLKRFGLGVGHVPGDDIVTMHLLAAALRTNTTPDSYIRVCEDCTRRAAILTGAGAPTETERGALLAVLGMFTARSWPLYIRSLVTAALNGTKDERVAALRAIRDDFLKNANYALDAFEQAHPQYDTQKLMDGFLRYSESATGDTVPVGSDFTIRFNMREFNPPAPTRSPLVLYELTGTKTDESIETPTITRVGATTSGLFKAFSVDELDDAATRSVLAIDEPQLRCAIHRCSDVFAVNRRNDDASHELAWKTAACLLSMAQTFDSWIELCKPGSTMEFYYTPPATPAQSWLELYAGTKDGKKAIEEATDAICGWFNSEHYAFGTSVFEAANFKRMQDALDHQVTPQLAEYVRCAHKLEALLSGVEPLRNAWNIPDPKDTFKLYCFHIVRHLNTLSYVSNTPSIFYPTKPELLI